MILENSDPFNKKGKQRLIMNCIILKGIALHGILEVLQNDLLVYCVIMIILFYAIFKPKSIMLYTLESSIGVNYRFLKAPFISNKICHER